MMNETKARAMAAEAGLTVSKTSQVKLDSTTWGVKDSIRTLTVGRAVVSYDTRNGGSYCWRVTLDGETQRAGAKGEAIAKAVQLQATN